MAGTDWTQNHQPKSAAFEADNGPAVILVEPQLGENIGMVARAMLNCGLTDLRLVRPRQGWPNAKAVKTSAGADSVIDQVQLFDKTEDAVADLAHVYAATARRRDMTMVVMTPGEAALDMREHPSGKVGVIFGGEAMGLSNDEVVFADKIITTPLNPGFTSLNLSQAVLIVAYEWFKLADQTSPRELLMSDTRPANKHEMTGLFEHLESELIKSGFLRVKERRPIMVRNIRNLFQRADLTEQEVRTLRGLIKSLVGAKR